MEGDAYSEKLESSFHKTVKKVSEDIEAMKFNTAIAAMMSLLNEIYEDVYKRQNMLGTCAA